MRPRSVPPLPDPLPARPTIPFAYLHRLARQIERTELNLAAQITAVDELHRALIDETDESVRQDILATLSILMTKPSKRTETEIEAILGTATFDLVRFGHWVSPRYTGDPGPSTWCQRN
jgi:serine/threonine kinase PknH